MPTLERAAHDARALGPDGTAGREELVHEVGEHRLGQLDERRRVRVALHDAEAVVGDPGERRPVFDAECQRRRAAQVVDDEVTVLGDESRQLARVEGDERVLRERASELLDPGKGAAGGVGAHGRPACQTVRPMRCAGGGGGRSLYVTMPGGASTTRGIALIAGIAVRIMPRTMKSANVVAWKSGGGRMPMRVVIVG